MANDPDENDWFVDRRDYVAFFREDALSRGRQLLLLHGHDGRGKTALLQKLQDVAKDEGAAVALVSCDKTAGAVDPIELMGDVARRLNLPTFKSFKDSLRQFVAPEVRIRVSESAGRQISVADGADLSHATFRDIIGSGLTMHNPTFVTESSKPLWSARVSELSGVFTETLVDASVERRIAIFLDHVDAAHEDMRNWIWRELIDSLRDAGRGQVLLVMALGKECPRLDAKTAHSARLRAVDALGHEHMVEYVIRRIVNIDAGEASGFVRGATARDQGNMHLLAAAVDAFVATQ